MAFITPWCTIKYEYGRHRSDRDRSRNLRILRRTCYPLDHLCIPSVLKLWWSILELLLYQIQQIMYQNDHYKKVSKIDSNNCLIDWLIWILSGIHNIWLITTTNRKRDSGLTPSFKNKRYKAWDLNKQERSRSEAMFCGVRSGSLLFAKDSVARHPQWRG